MTRPHIPRSHLWKQRKKNIKEKRKQLLNSRLRVFNSVQELREMQNLLKPMFYKTDGSLASQGKFPRGKSSLENMDTNCQQAHERIEKKEEEQQGSSLVLLPRPGYFCPLSNRWKIRQSKTVSLKSKCLGFVTDVMDWNARCVHLNTITCMKNRVD